MSAKVMIKNIGEKPVNVTRADGVVETLQPLERKSFDSDRGGAVVGISEVFDETTAEEGDFTDETPQPEAKKPAENAVFKPAKVDKKAKK